LQELRDKLPVRLVRSLEQRLEQGAVAQHRRSDFIPQVFLTTLRIWPEGTGEVNEYIQSRAPGPLLAVHRHVDQAWDRRDHHREVGAGVVVAESEQDPVICLATFGLRGRRSQAAQRTRHRVTSVPGRLLEPLPRYGVQLVQHRSQSLNESWRPPNTEISRACPSWPWLVRCLLLFCGCRLEDVKIVKYESKLVAAPEKHDLSGQVAVLSVERDIMFD
jgi:hypothetical protein